ncbi:hypothetical protein PRZ48_010126 [Zasmidium cellare]|uniref:Zn(2)-C6 fungal-type domain-containing protein n=1 Tax=Zasmidium cellare TaxID=395010 RepID=A0ABR0EEI1_ZASCE|nr:hypothetical protein PRZ48_010126 [Zasmidium cellare]
MASAEEKSPSAVRKRKHSPNGTDHGRAIKHRASHACQSCRTRKVRCDVLVNAPRCTNCRLDQLECIVIASRRGQNKRRKIRHDPPPRLDDSADIVCEPSIARKTSGQELNVPENEVGSVPVCVSFDDEPADNRDDKDHGNDNNTSPSSGYLPAVGENFVPNISPSASYGSLLTPDMRAENSLQLQKTTLPAFITPLSSQLPSEDFEYLDRKGAFTIPDPDLRVEILRAYLFSVHPFMPVLDYRGFITAILNDQPGNRVSLLLFQAVMFAGLHSLQQPILHRLGFELAKQARVVFFNRVRLLYEFDVEPDITAVFQSLVLMSSWYSKWDSRRDTWHWTGLAYDVARRMGLHREPTAKFATERIRRFRRRLWWSLYIRDRLISLGTRRPMRIYDADCDVGMLTIEDFDLEPLDECYRGQALTPGTMQMKAIALMCVHLAKLCVHAGHVVSSQYSTLRTHNGQDIPHAVMVVSRRDEGREEELESCDRELNGWFEELKTQVQPLCFPTGQTNGSYSCSEVHWAELNLTYQTTVNVLYRTQALQSTESNSAAQRTSLRSRVKRSACELTKLSHCMLRRDQLRSMGLIGVTAIIAAYLSHMLDITSAAAEDDDDARDASTFRLYQSLEVLQSFQNIYASADAAVSFLASVSQKAGISVPLQAGKSATASTSGATTSHTLALDGRQSAKMGDTLEVQTGQAAAQQLVWQASPFSTSQALVNDHRHPAKNNAVLDLGTTLTQANQSSIIPFSDTTVVDQSNSAGNVTSFDWSNGMDYNMDLSLMSFDHDFYLDTFGFTDTRSQGL